MKIAFTVWVDTSMRLGQEYLYHLTELLVEGITIRISDMQLYSKANTYVIPEIVDKSLALIILRLRNFLPF